MGRKTGREVGEMFSDFVNSGFHSEREEFAETIAYDHRTLQGDSFLTFLKCIEHWSNAYDSGDYDARNEYACKASKVMLDALKEKGLF